MNGYGRMGLDSPKDLGAVRNTPLSDIDCSHCGKRKVPLRALQYGDKHCSRKCAEVANGIEAVEHSYSEVVGGRTNRKGDVYIQRDVAPTLGEVLGTYVAPRPTKTARRRPYKDRRSPTDDAAIIADYQAGLSFMRVAKKHGVSASVVRDRLKEYGVTARPRDATIRLPRKVIDEPALVADYTTGGTLKDLAKKYHLSAQGVLNRLHRLGVATRTRREGLQLPRKAPPIGDLLTAYASGMSTAAIARKYGIDSVTVWRWLKKAGVMR